MPVSAPFDRVAIETTLVAWIANATGVACMLANQDAPQPAHPYATIALIAKASNGQDEQRETAVADPVDGSEIEISLSSQKTLTVSINFYTHTNNAGQDARSLCDIARAAAALPSFRAAFETAGIAFLREIGQQSLDEINANAFVQRAQMDCMFSVAENVAEFTGYIAQVNVTEVLTGFVPIAIDDVASTVDNIASTFCALSFPQAAGYTFKGSAKGSSTSLQPSGGATINAVGNLNPGTLVGIADTAVVSHALLDNAIYEVTGSVTANAIGTIAFTLTATTHAGAITITDFVITSGPSELVASSAGLMLTISVLAGLVESGGVCTQTVAGTFAAVPYAFQTVTRAITFHGTLNNTTINTTIDTDTGGQPWTITPEYVAPGGMNIAIAGALGAGAISWTGELVVSRPNPVLAFEVTQ